MAKLSINALLETSKMLATKAGQELKDLLDYTNSISDNMLRALRQGLTFDDNIKGTSLTASLLHNTPQIINYDRRQNIFAVIPVRTISTETGIDSMLWYMDSSSNLTVKVGFTGAPTTKVDTVLAIFYK